MKRLLFTLLLLQVFSFGQSQLRFVNTDSLKLELNSQPDTTRVLSYANLCFNYAFRQVDSALAYGQKAIHLANQIQFKKAMRLPFFLMDGLYGHRVITIKPSKLN
jgi:hypothetical protein